MNPLAIVASSLVTCLGSGRQKTLEALLGARSGLRPCDFDTVRLPTYIGAVDAVEDMTIEGALAAFDCRANRLCRLALRDPEFAAAVRAAVARYGAGRIGVFAGTSTAGILQTELAFRRRDPASGKLPDDFRYAETHNIFSVADFVQRELGLHGPALCVSAACASTAKAFGNAARMIQLGLCDAAIVGGADSLCLTTLYGFHSLQLTAEEPCRPYDARRDGISIGEGAGFVLIERAQAGDDDTVALLGVGESSDAHHMSAPHPEGLGALRAMAASLAAAGLVARDIDYINLHGTATRAGDLAEDAAVTSLFGGDVPCSSTKGLTGHLLGASGVVEAIIAEMAIRDGFVPASPTTQNLDPALHARYEVAGARRRIDRVMTNSFGFGGSNCSLVLGRQR